MNINAFISFKQTVAANTLFDSQNVYDVLKEVRRGLPFSCRNKTLTQMAIMESKASGEWQIIKKSKKQREAEREAERIASLPF